MSLQFIIKTSYNFEDLEKNFLLLANVSRFFRLKKSTLVSRSLRRLLMNREKIQS